MKSTTRVVLLILLSIGAALPLARPEARPIAPIQLTQAPQTVDLTLINTAKNPRVGLPDFLGASTDADLVAAAKTLTEVLWNDLEFEREFYMIPRPTSASIPAVAVEALPYQRWSEMGADFVLVGSVSRRGTDMAVELRMIAVRGENQGKQSFGKAYPNCKTDDPRACAHAIADDFHKDTRGLNGVARTKLAFASDRHGSRVAGRPSQTAAASKEIYVSDYDGANQMRVTVNGHINCCPSWSPSGGMLSYVSWVTGFPDIYLINLTQPGRVGKPAGGGPTVSNTTPAWSPDGSKLAFVSNRSGNFDVWIVNRDGSGLFNLTNNSAGDVAPTWSPNGQQLAFISDRGGTNQLYLISATGTGVQLLVNDKIDRPTWSTLNFIAFTVGSGPGHDIGIYDFSNPGAVRVLTDGQGSNESPSVAPNGRHIAFFTTRWGRQHIATIDRRGERIKRITEVGNNTYPNWQPITNP